MGVNWSQVLWSPPLVDTGGIARTVISVWLSFSVLEDNVHFYIQFTDPIFLYKNGVGQKTWLDCGSLRTGLVTPGLTKIM